MVLENVNQEEYKLLLDKLKVDYDLNVNYFRLGFFSNSLLLNKKMYLLYNIFNKKREFFLLKKKERQVGSYFFNYLTYNTLNNAIFNVKKEKFDYFIKWSSSFLGCSDINLRNVDINFNRKKFFLNTKISLNYTVSDDIFFDYHLNKNKSYFYLNKNMFYLNVLFKLSKKQKMKFKNFLFFDLYKYYNDLNLNYYNILNKKYWINYTNLDFFLKMKLRMKEYILNNIHSFIFSYSRIEKINFLKYTSLISFLGLFKTTALLNKNVVNKNYMTNKEKKTFFFLRNLKKTFFLQKKFNKIFFRYKRKYALNLVKKRFLSLMSLNILRNLKKRTFLNFLRKKKLKNKLFFSKNFYVFKNFLPNMYLKEKYKKLKRKLKKKYNYRLIKKLKKFNYISGRSNLTRQQVYRRFKNKIIRKLKKKKKLKKKHFYLKANKYRFNLFIYNSRNGYKNRMKAKELKLLISPKYFYSDNKSSDYRDIEKLEKGLDWYELPDNIMSKFNKNWKKEDTLLQEAFYSYGDKKINDLIFFKHYNEWKKNNIKSKVSFFEYKKFLIKREKKEKKKKIINYFKGFNTHFNVNKHLLWIFQKMFIFFKNTHIIKNYKISNLYINYNKYKTLYYNLIFIIINIFKVYVSRYLHKDKKKWVFYLKKVRRMLTFLKIIYNFFFVKKKVKLIKNWRKKLRKKYNINVIKNKKKVEEKKQVITTTKKKDTGFLSIYNDNKNLKTIDKWKNIIEDIPWMSFKDKRIFDKKNKFYLNLIIDKKEKKSFLDWVAKIDKRMKEARLSYKKKKYDINSN